MIFFALAFVLSTYFTFAAVQGDFGLFRRIEITAEADALREDLARLQEQIGCRMIFWIWICWTSRRVRFWGCCARMRSSFARTRRV